MLSLYFAGKIVEFQNILSENVDHFNNMVRNEAGDVRYYLIRVFGIW